MFSDRVVQWPEGQGKNNGPEDREKKSVKRPKAEGQKANRRNPAGAHLGEGRHRALDTRLNKYVRQLPEINP